MKRTLTFPSTLFAAGLLAACANPAQLRTGMTEAEVRQHMGAPLAEVPLAGGKRLQYVNPPFDTAVPVNRTKVRMGEAILVVQTPDVDGVYERARVSGATIAVPPTTWEVPSHDGKSVIRLRTMSMFDPTGVYSEVNQHLS